MTKTLEELIVAWNGNNERGAFKNFASKTQIDPSAITRYCRSFMIPKEDKLQIIAQELHIKPETVVLSIKEGEKRANEFTSTLSAVPLISKNTLSLPILADVPAGLPEFSDADVETFFDIPRWVFPGADFVVKCIGDSLEPEIRKGDFCVIRKTTEPIDGKQMLIRTECGICMKVIRKSKAGKIWLASLNPKYAPFTSEELQVIGVILGHWGRNDKDTFKVDIPED